MKSRIIQLSVLVALMGGFSLMLWPEKPKFEKYRGKWPLGYGNYGEINIQKAGKYFLITVKGIYTSCEFKTGCFIPLGKKQPLICGATDTSLFYSMAERWRK